MFQKKKLYTKSKHVFYVKYFFFPENSAVYEIMWKNMVARKDIGEIMAHAHCMLDT